MVWRRNGRGARETEQEKERENWETAKQVMEDRRGGVWGLLDYFKIEGVGCFDQDCIRKSSTIPSLPIQK